MERDTQLSQPKPPYSRQEDFGPQEGSTSGPMGKSSEMGRLQHTKGPLEGNKALNADGDSLKSPSPLPSAQDYLSPGRASPRVLPPVEEETHEELEKDGRNHDHDTFAETNRDSGVITGSPDPMRRSLAEEPSQRDSGIHLRDVAESMAEKQEERQDKEGMAIRTPQPHDRRLQKPGLGSEMPSLGTPTSSSREEERQNTIDPRKTRSQKEQEIGHRSISESVSRRSTPLAERQLRRTVSNTSISRQRTPEPLSMKFRPESPGIRSGINAPPLRRADRRMSGDLRSLSSNLPNNNNALSEREILPHQTTAPVANEGRVRAKDMTDVYVSDH
ncbi:hypothetical protein GGS23DRAFT_278643 [Durotheca rogersii]|uniref:uncharacterized protein n=1 Tax=Durotheca rogersii TaxID=419775 RepID=UPI002220BD35|nr:uncharacterized protein GGS23DRAFT_278643 [Durotheca rogersii]KAI5866599.1 hypothetical protein GGS23DRAFT_278643 [Durotheca rogersii]